VSALDYPALASDTREVLRSLTSIETQVSARDNRWFTVRVMPYRTQENRVDGVVITLTDISAAKVLEAALRKAQFDLEARISQQTKALPKPSSSSKTAGRRPATKPAKAPGRSRFDQAGGGSDE
jgi:hypothetical protein